MVLRVGRVHSAAAACAHLGASVLPQHPAQSRVLFGDTEKHMVLRVGRVQSAPAASARLSASVLPQPTARSRVLFTLVILRSKAKLVSICRWCMWAAGGDSSMV